jgi:hypothetical protein
VKLVLKARRKSTDVHDLPEIFAFEVEYEGQLREIVDCLSRHAFDMYQVQGEPLPRRACPIRPKGMTAGEHGPPAEWVDDAGRLKREIWENPGSPGSPFQPIDRFVSVVIDQCNGCKFAGAGTIGIKKDQDAILEAFAAQLKKEDFTGFDLSDEDRDVRRWTIHWDDVEVQE